MHLFLYLFLQIFTLSTFSMAYDVTLITGDGTGPELAEAARRCVDATGIKINWDPQEAGVDVMARTGTPLPDAVLESVRRTRCALKAPITTPVGTGFRSINVYLRQELGLFACIRPCKQYQGVRTFFNDVKVDIVIVRENTEDLYAGVEFESGKPETEKLVDFINSIGDKKIKTKASETGVSIKPISISGTERIVRCAFEYARNNKRKKVTAVHKANIMKFSDGLYLATAQRVAKEFPDIEFEDRIVDNMCMQLVQKPELYDVLVLPNLYGDIISDLGAGLVGGLGVAPGENVGPGGAVFEATHGSAPKYKGLNKVNPTALILSGMLMLRHLGEHDAAARLEKAVGDVIAEGKYVTYDLKPHRDDPTAVGTREMADAICAKLK
jgi:isocitrate dehydrogenase (NAD+)